jgi:hypothetical protein
MVHLQTQTLACGSIMLCKWTQRSMIPCAERLLPTSNWRPIDILPAVMKGVRSTCAPKGRSSNYILFFQIYSCLQVFENALLIICISTQRTGYFLSANSTLVTATELMNENPQNRSAVLTVDYEFIPANPFPPSFQNLTSAWLDVGGCRNSDVPVVNNSTFTINTPTSWTVPNNLFPHGSGQTIFTEGHLHDGGTHVEILRNDETICTSSATYGGTSGFVDSDMAHISSMTSCGVNEPSVEDNVVREGEKFDLRAHYDLSSHKGLLEPDGTMAPVMGIAIIYMAPSTDAKV